MNIDNFAIWKFKNVEGILKNFYAYDFTITKYQKGFTTFFIHYDVTAETVTFKTASSPKFDGITCSFKDLRSTLMKLGVFELKSKDDCHSSATWGNDLFK